jgi:hypothetical protein
MARLKVGWYEKLLTKAMSAVMVIVICFKPGWCKQTIVNISADVALVYNSYHVVFNHKCGRTGRQNQIRLLLQADHCCCPSTAVVCSEAESDLVQPPLVLKRSGWSQQVKGMLRSVGSAWVS